MLHLHLHALDRPSIGAPDTLLPCCAAVTSAIATIAAEPRPEGCLHAERTKRQHRYFG